MRRYKIRVVEPGHLNIREELAKENIRTNIKRNLPVLGSTGTQLSETKRIALVGGGPSLESTLPQLHEAVERNAFVVALNGASDWLVSKGISPHGHIILDGRPFNERFVRNPVPGCIYIICSHCDPKVLDHLEGQKVFLFHAGCTAKLMLDELVEHYKPQRVWLNKAGPTVAIASLWLLRALGYRYYELFGIDSCVMDGRHHAYPQDENNDALTIELKINDRVFQLQKWMVAQAQDFLKFMHKVSHEYEDIVVHGDGLIAWLMRCIAVEGELRYGDLPTGVIDSWLLPPGDSLDLPSN